MINNMWIRRHIDLLLFDLLTILIITNSVFVHSHAVQLVLGLPFLLFIPGYSLTVVLFPKDHQLNNLEKIAASLGLSICMFIIIGIIINYTFGFSFYPFYSIMMLLVILLSILAIIRRDKINQVKIIKTSGNSDTKFTLKELAGWIRSNKILTIVFAVIFICILVASVYAINSPRYPEQFTEFYILGPSGEAANYPSELKIMTDISVTAGIGNHESNTNVYRIDVKVNGTVVKNIPNISVDSEETKELKINLTAIELGNNQRIDFYLYKEGVDNPLRILYLTVNVVS